MFNILITVVLVLGAFASIIAFLNTQKILIDLSKIKKQLGIKEVKKQSFFDKDLDID